MDLATLLPEALSPLAACLAVAAAMIAAALTAAFGLGGGLILLAVLSAIFPAPAIVPVHGVAQLGSNAGRFALTYRDAVWPIVLWFLLGGLVGASAGGRLALEAPVWLLRGGVALFIVYTLWGPRPTAFAPGRVAFFLAGVVGGFLTMFFGATGPIAATMLGEAKLNRLQLVATHAATMVAQHGTKVVIFAALGFAYADWAALIAAMLAAGFAGTLVGTHFLRRMPEALFRRGFRAVLTGVAIYLFAAAAIDFKTG